MAALDNPKVKELPSFQREDARHNAIAWLEKQIRVKCLDERAGVVTVSLTSSDPQEAAVLVNAVVEGYMHEFVDRDRQTRRQRLSEIEKITAEKENEIRAEREKLKRDLESAGEKKATEADSAVKSPVSLPMERAEVENLERVLQGVALEREMLKVELDAPPPVRVLGNRNAPASVTESRN